MSEVVKNKIKYGLKKLYYAVITAESESSVTYGTPVPMPGAISISLKSLFESTAIDADDDPAYVEVNDNKGYDGDLEVTNLDDDFLIDVIGYTKDANDVLIEPRELNPKPVALLFEFKGDKKKTRHLLYRCMFTKPDIESGTSGEKIEAKTDKITFKASPAKDTGEIKAKSTEGDTKFANWYNAVYPSVPVLDDDNDEN